MKVAENNLPTKKSKMVPCANSVNTLERQVKWLQVFRINETLLVAKAEV